jgi:D-glycero-D-manno-heptose 1,7-bisphosphate phosphatase
MAMNPAVFLDRDGVIIQNRENYVRSWTDVEFIPTSLYALERLSQTAHKIIIITNQSAVGRGIITLKQADAINRRIIEAIKKSGGRVDGFFMCPHTPEEHCSCRKPLPGLIQKAAEELSIDLESSVLIGDALTDIQAGSAAGIKTLILVKTGRGQEQLLLAQTAGNPRFLITEHLLSAMNIVLSKPLL